MESLVFAGPVAVQIAGETVLGFLKVQGDYAKYQVARFQDPPIFICDYRPASMKAAQAKRRKNQAEKRIEAFNQRAEARVYLEADGSYRVELRDCGEAEPEHTLWITAGQGEWFPAYDYLLSEVSSAEEEPFTFFSIYHHNGLPVSWPSHSEQEPARYLAH